jgi:hypothetical protein
MFCVLEMKQHKSMEELEKLDKIVGKFPNQTVEFYMKKLGWGKSKTYDYLQTLKNQQKIPEENHYFEGVKAYWHHRAKTEIGNFYKDLMEYFEQKKGR